MNNFTFGNFICELREKKGLTQGELGKKLGVSNKAVSKWENGGAYPSSELMLPLARELGISIEELYGAISNSKSEKSKLRRFLDKLSEKSTVVIIASAVYLSVMYILYLIFGVAEDKNMVLIFTPIATVMFYGFVRLLFFVFKKNPVTPPKYIDFVMLFLLIAAAIMFVQSLSALIFDFPNTVLPGHGATLGITSGVLRANKKRL